MIDWTNQTEVERAWELGQRMGLKGLPGPLTLPLHLYDSSSDIKKTLNDRNTYQCETYQTTISHYSMGNTHLHIT
jgi:hypothetical protein